MFALNSPFAYGTWHLMDDPAGHAPERILEKLRLCLELGVTTIDTAEIYGLYTVEEALGRAFCLEPGLRQRFQIVSKSGIYIPCEAFPHTRVKHYDASYSAILRAAEKSLRLLQTDCLDVLLVHRPDWLSPAEETARALNQLQKEGKILHAGVSNYSVHHLEALSAFLDKPLVTNQVEFSLLRMDPMIDGTFDQCQRLKFRPMAWSALAAGKLFDAATPAGSRLQAVAEELALAYDGATLEQLATAWVLAHPARPQVILGSNRLERMRAQARASALKLSHQDWYLLWEAAQGRQIP